MNYKLVSLFQLVHIHSLSCVNAAATCTQWRLSRVAVTSKCCTSPLLYFTSLFTFIFPPSFSYLPSALNMEELICSFCSQHLILFIFPLVFFSFFLLFYLSHPHHLLSGRAVLSGPSRALGLSGVMDDYQPSAVFHYAPERFTGSLTTRHENQSLFLILPTLLLSMPASLLPSRTFIFNILSVKKKINK